MSALKETNLYLRDPEKYHKALIKNVASSTAIEIGIAKMTYIFCTRNKSQPQKAVAVCAHCKHNKRCKDYQQYKTKREKEVVILNEENKIIPMFPVESKNLLAVGYNANNRTMRIEFRQGAFYDYMDVPPETFQQIMGSQSKGKFFHSAVKGKYEFIKVAK